MSGKTKTTGKREVNAALTPKLRFSEFRGAAGWEERNLGSVCQMQAGKFVAASDIHERSTHGFYPCYGGNGLRGYTNSFTHSGKFPLIGRQGALCGNVRLGFGKFHATEHAVVATAEIGVDVDWLFYVLGFLNLNRFATGQAQPGLSVDVIAKIPVFKPVHEAEQQKIAECLTTLDAVIAAQSQKIDALKTHKKGLMQQLFPREGETLPRLRFPEFQAAPAWKSEKAGELFTHRVESGASKLPIYSVTMNDGMVKRSSLDRHVDDIADPGANKKASKDDIAYNMMRMWQGAFGVAVEDCMVSPAYVVLAPRTGICSEFFEYLLKLPNSLRRLTANSQGLTKDRLRLYYKDFATIPLPHPSFGEQHQIADCLTTLDNLITAETQKRDALKTHKKGLMQQLFPSPEAVEK